MKWHGERVAGGLILREGWVGRTGMIRGGDLARVRWHRKGVGGLWSEILMGAMTYGLQGWNGVGKGWGGPGGVGMVWGRAGVGWVLRIGLLAHGIPVVPRKAAVEVSNETSKRGALLWRMDGGQTFWWTSLSLSLPLSPSLYYIYLSLYYIYLSICLSVYLSVYLSIYPPIYLTIYLTNCLSI